MWLAGPPDSIIVAMGPEEDYLVLDDESLLGQCRVQTYRSSGPGGQHRNKVSSAVRLRHEPTGITVHAEKSRSQHDNKRLAVQQLRMNIACRLRRPIDKSHPTIPAVVKECIFTPRGGRSGASRRLEVGRKDHRFWRVAGFALDMLESFEGRCADAAGYLGITTSNLTSFFKSERHLFGSAQAIRKNHGLKPLS